MKRFIKQLLAIFIIVASVFVAYKMIQSKDALRQKPKKINATVYTQKVHNTDVKINIKATGRLEAKRKVDLFSEVQGIFLPQKKLFKTGVKYRKNDLIISIDDSEFLANVQSQKSSFINLIVNILPDMRFDFPEAYDKWENYAFNLDIDKPIPELPKFTSKKEWFFINSKKILTTFHNLKNLEQRLSKYKIYAPFTGILTEASINMGTLVRSNQKLGEFIDPSVFEIKLSVNKSYANYLTVGNYAILRNNDSEEWEGKVVRVNKKVDPLTQTVSVFVQTHGDNLKEGMFLEVYIDAGEIKNAIKIPRGLIENEQVYTVKDSLLKQVRIKSVFFIGDKAIIRGLPNGSDLVIKPVYGAHENMPIIPIEKEHNFKN